MQTHKERSLDFLCKNLVRRCCAFCCSEAVNITGFLQQGGVVGNKSNAHIPRMFCPRIQLLRCMTKATLTSVYTYEYLVFQRVTQWLTDPHVRDLMGVCCVQCFMVSILMYTFYDTVSSIVRESKMSVCFERECLPQTDKCET